MKSPTPSSQEVWRVQVLPLQTKAPGVCAPGFPFIESVGSAQTAQGVTGRVEGEGRSLSRSGAMADNRFSASAPAPEDLSGLAASR